MDTTNPTPTPSSQEEQLSKRESVWELIKFIILTLAIVIPIRVYVAQPFFVSGTSMDPTFKGGDYLIIDELTYHFRTPERGEVVVFRYPKDPSKYFIKRVIGLPGETVTIRENTVTITPTEGESFVLDEEYIKNQGFNNMSLTLESGEYFVMGDNRPASLDSRSWGAVSEKEIKGRAFLRLWPFTKVDVFPGATTSTK